MKLYHYSITEYDVLKSKVAQGRSSKIPLDRKPALLSKVEGKIIKLMDRLKLNKEFDYDRSISLFLEPIPLDIASIYHDKHSFWQAGVKLFQYEIYSSDLPDDIAFRLVESPEKTKLLYEIQDWSIAKDQPEVIPKYLKQIQDMETSHGYVDHGVEDLEKICSKFKGIRKYMLEAAEIAKEYPEDGGYEKYAACVPHVMIYPGHKEIPFDSVKEIILK